MLNAKYRGFGAFPARTRQSGRLASNGHQVYIVTELQALRMHAQDLLAALDVRTVQRYLPVKASRAEQGGIENLGHIGRGHDDDTGLGIEAVHLH